MMPSEIDTLAEMLDKAEALPRSYEQIQWAKWLSNDARMIRSLDGYGIEHLLSAYGGMGSINDVVLQRITTGNEVVVPESDNERFALLRNEIYVLARSLRSRAS